MSIYATKWAYGQHITPAGRKFVLVAIADFADSEGRAFPGAKTLADMTGQDERSIRRHIDALEKAGYLRSEQRRRKDGSRTTDELWVLAPEEALRPEPTGQHARKPRAQQPDKMTASQADTVSGPTGQDVRAYRTPCQDSPDKLSGHEPSVNHQLNHQEKENTQTLAADAAVCVPESSETQSAEPTPPAFAVPKATTQAKAGSTQPEALDTVAPAAPPVPSKTVQRLMAVYNDHRKHLPAAESANTGREKALKRLLGQFGSLDAAAAALADATQEVAADAFWQGKGWGLDNLLPKISQKAEAWRARSPLPTSTDPAHREPTYEERYS